MRAGSARLERARAHGSGLHGREGSFLGHVVATFGCSG